MEIQRIIAQVNKMYNDNWAGVDVHLLFNEIDNATANKKTRAFKNTIHQIAQHILATERVVINRLQGIPYELSVEEDWIPMKELKKIDWSDTISQIKQSKKKLIQQIKSIDDVDLNKPIIKGYSSIYETLHGHIQHTYYHLGQIVVIKNLLIKD